MKPLTVKKNVLLKYALAATAVYIFYFMIMKTLGYAHIPEFRFLNYFLYFFITYMALYELIRVKKVRMEYLEGMAFTFILGAVSFIGFALFILIYSLFNPLFVEIAGSNMQSAGQLGIWGPACLICAEGLGISSVVSICMMQYFQAFSSKRQLFLFYRRSLLKINHNRFKKELKQIGP